MSMRSGKKLAALGLVCALITPGIIGFTQEGTPSVAPNIQETPLPPAVELPPPPGTPAQETSRPLNATEAARIALLRQPNILSAQASVTAAQARTQQARSSLFPLLGLSAGYTRTQNISSEGNSSFSSGGSSGGTSSLSNNDSFNATATLRQLIFDFNHTRNLVRQAQQNERAVEAGLDKTRSDTVLQVKQAFYTYSQNIRLVAVNEDTLRNQQLHLALAQARFNTGLGLPSDVVRAQTAVSSAILNLNIARNNASVSRVSLTTLMGIDPRTPIVIDDKGEPDFPSNDVNGLVDIALRKRPEIIQAQANLRALDASLSAARSSNLPSIGGNFALSSRGGNFPPGNDSWAVGATLSFNPFDSGLTAGRTREAQANLVSARAQLAGVQLTVTQDVSQSWINLRTAEQRVVTADAEVANAQESLRLAEGRFQSGVGLFLDVTDAQSALVTAQTNRVNSQSAVDQARAALLHAQGVPLR